MPDLDALVAQLPDGAVIVDPDLIVFDAADPDETARAQEAYRQVMELAIGLGGTITGEHGVGRLKKDWLPTYLSADVMDLNRRVKAALDPQGILNPGAML
jgi:glycolate oxidase